MRCSLNKKTVKDSDAKQLSIDGRADFARSGTPLQIRDSIERSWYSAAIFTETFLRKHCVLVKLSFATMDALRETIHINNEAILGLRFCDGDSSKSSCLSEFQRAVCLMRSFSDDMDAAFGSPANGTSESRRSSSFNSIGFCFDPENNETVSLKGLLSDSGHVYNRPLMLQTNIAVTNLNDLESLGLVVSTTVIFNLALAWHQRGVNTGNELSLSKAGKLYDLILAILKNNSTEEDHYGKTHRVLKCLALNNRAHIHYQQGDYLNSRKCMRDVFVLLKYTDYLEIYLGSMEVQEIRLNVFHLRTPSVALAA